MPTIFEELRADHDVQRSLLATLLETEGASDERDRTWRKLKDALETHAASEERYFYAPLFQHDQTVEKARHSVAEHHELDELIERLEDTEMDSPGWLQIARQLGEKLEHHLEEEEHEVFQMAGKVLTETQKTELASEYRAEMGAPAAAA